MILVSKDHFFKYQICLGPRVGSVGLSWVLDSKHEPLTTIPITYTKIYHACMHAWMYGCMDVRMYGYMDVRMHGCMDVWMYGCKDVWMYVCMYLQYDIALYSYIWTS